MTLEFQNSTIIILCIYDKGKILPPKELLSIYLYIGEEDPKDFVFSVQGVVMKLWEDCMEFRAFMHSSSKHHHYHHDSSI